MVDVRSDYPKFQDAGAEVLVVTMGTVAQTAAFRRRHELPFHCLADPERSAYEAYEVPRGNLAQIAGPAIWGAGAKALFKHGVGVPVGDTKQLQGSFVVDSLGVLRFVFVPVNSAQNATNEELLSVLGAIARENESRGTGL